MITYAGLKLAASLFMGACLLVVVVCGLWVVGVGLRQALQADLTDGGDDQ